VEPQHAAHALLGHDPNPIAPLDMQQFVTSNRVIDRGAAGSSTTGCQSPNVTGPPLRGTANVCRYTEPLLHLPELLLGDTDRVDSASAAESDAQHRHS